MIQHDMIYTNPWVNHTHHPKGQLDHITHFYATTQQIPIGYNGMPHIHLQNCPFPWGDLHPDLLASSLDTVDLPSKSASRSHSYFPQYTRQKDRQTPDTQTPTHIETDWQMA